MLFDNKAVRFGIHFCVTGFYSIAEIVAKTLSSRMYLVSLKVSNSIQ